MLKKAETFVEGRHDITSAKIPRPTTAETQVKNTDSLFSAVLRLRFVMMIKGGGDFQRFSMSNVEGKNNVMSGLLTYSLYSFKVRRQTGRSEKWKMFLTTDNEVLVVKGCSCSFIGR